MKNRKNASPAMLFAGRNFMELLRDPLSYVFCLGFPIVMLIVFQIFSGYAPGVSMFRLDELTPGICVFSYSFVMLYMALLVSKDRATSFLSRLFTSPMRNVDFVVGYILPGLVITLLQTIICYIVALIIGAITGVLMLPQGILASFAVLLPSMLFFVCAGLIFGSVFSEKSAPGLSSIIISLAGFTSGAWIPLESMGGFGRFCSFLPFYPAVLVGRHALQLEGFGFEEFWLKLIISTSWCAIAFVLAVVLFGSRANRKNG